MTNWFDSVDMYCERLDPSFWAEPFNALSNLSFIVAGFLLWRLRSPRSKLIATLVILIGLGSFSFHTFANRLTGLIDVLVIAIYLVTFAFLIPKQWSKKSILIQLGSTLLFILIVVLTQLLMNLLKPSAPWLPPGMYLGAWLAGNGCVPIHNLMEDAATAEISRSQVWQWIRSPKGVLDDGRKVTAEMVKGFIKEELVKVSNSGAVGHWNRAAEIFDQMSTGESFEEFLTLPLYEEI